MLALDVNMLALLGEAKERTAEDYVRIGCVVPTSNVRNEVIESSLPLGLQLV